MPGCYGSFPFLVSHRLFYKPGESPVNTSQHSQVARSLFIFNRDLRTCDHPLLHQACAQSDEIMFLFCLQPWEFTSPYLTDSAMGQARWGFLQHSLLDLSRALKRHGHCLVVHCGDWSDVVPKLLAQHGFTHLYHSHVAGHYEQQTWLQLADACPELTWVNDHTSTLFRASELPFVVADLPKHFTPFRKQVEPLDFEPDVDAPPVWPQPILPIEVALPPWLTEAASRQ